MIEKRCRTCCELKLLSEYYKHRQMADGHLNICKECTKKRISSHREENIDRIREYDRGRGKLPHRKKLNTVITRNKRKTIKGYRAAHDAIGRAVANGLIIKPSICSWCKKEHHKIESHHPDYSKKLLVIWLCIICHRRLHLGRGKEAEKMRDVISIPDECDKFNKFNNILCKIN